VLFALAAAAFGCGDKATHTSVDEWMRTEKGPGKLKKAVGGNIDADLSAHAAQNLIRMDKTEMVVEAIGALAPERRASVFDKLIPRLWQDARIEGEMAIPNSLQVGAKDALFDLRKLADGMQKDKFDSYLVEWLTGGYYDGRAKVGRSLGAAVVRAIGASAGASLIVAAKRVIAAPADGTAKRRRPKIEDELMLGLAASGSTDAIQLVLDIYKMDRGDDSLPERALSALFRAYVDPGGLFDNREPAPLEPDLNELIEIAGDSSRSSRITNDAIALISAVGMPKCLAALVELMAAPNRDARFRYVGADSALRCGGVQAIVPVAEALPTDGPYEAAELKGAVWGSIVKMSPRKAVAEAGLTLLKSASPIARWVGVEVLANLGSEAAPVTIAAIRALSGDKTRLEGYWGRSSNKKVPSLGERAAEAARSLEQGGRVTQ
jgi:hypothetical protein